MKDLIQLVLKVLPVHSRLLALFLLLPFFQANAQSTCHERSYEVINAIFDSTDVKIYHRTLFSKGWAYYFEDYDQIFRKVGIPTYVSDKDLQKILGKEEMRKINTSIYALNPCELLSTKLNKNIILSPQFDTEKFISRGVLRISEPIIVEDKIAIIKIETLWESPIHILKKENGKLFIPFTTG